MEKDAPDFAREQNGVALAMLGALCVTVIVIAGAVVAGQAAAPLPFAMRLQAALRADAFVLACVALAIGNVARLRFFSPEDIAGGATGSASARVRRASAILQNTAEQAGLAIGTHMVVAATFAASLVPVAALAGLFMTGRILFWAGYARGARGRAFGFALTFYPSVLALAAAILSIVAGWPA